MTLKLLIAAAALALGLCTSSRAAPTPAPTPDPTQAQPKLVVVISVDQFASHLFEQWRPKFTAGLKTLASDGVVYSNGYLANSATETCPGHAMLLTGMFPAHNGIVANNWYDASTGRDLYCVADDASPLVGLPASIPDKDQRRAGRSPKNMTATTLGDWLQSASPNNRAYAISGKDRAAITMAGQNPTGVFWYVDGAGFVTYAKAGVTAEDRMKPVAAFNAELMAAWAKAPPVWTYADPACARLEQQFTVNDYEFNSKIPPEVPQPTPGMPFDTSDSVRPFYRATPLLDELTLGLAARLIREQKLGRGKGIDILSISLSSTDYIGHRFGTQGPEMCDQMTRLDRGLATLLAQLTALKVPVIVALSADHGSMDVVERTQSAGFPAKRVATGAILAQVNQKLREQLQLPFYNPLVAADNSRDIQQTHIVNAEGLAETGPLREKILEATKLILATDYKADIVGAYSRAEAIAAMPPKDLPYDEYSMLQRFAVNADATRSADLFVVGRPYAYGGFPRATGDTIAGHGSPYNYDRRVPVLFWWPGSVARERPLPVGTVDIGPTLAHVLGQPVPAGLDGRCLPVGTFNAAPCPAN